MLQWTAAGRLTMWFSSMAVSMAFFAGDDGGVGSSAEEDESFLFSFANFCCLIYPLKYFTTSSFLGLKLVKYEGKEDEVKRGLGFCREGRQEKENFRRI